MEGTRELRERGGGRLCRESASTRRPRRARVSVVSFSAGDEKRYHRDERAREDTRDGALRSDEPSRPLT
jgi:hypothetical protein